MNIDVFTWVLEDLANHFQIGQKRRVVLALEQASFETSDQLEIPQGIHLLMLPPKSPELQPAERLWPLAEQPLVNQAFSALEELEEVLGQRCRVLIEKPNWLKGYTQDHWWPDKTA